MKPFPGRTRPPLSRRAETARPAGNVTPFRIRKGQLEVALEADAEIFRIGEARHDRNLGDRQVDPGAAGRRVSAVCP